MDLRYAGEGFDRELAGMRNEEEVRALANTLEMLGAMKNGEGMDELKKRMKNTHANAANVLARFNEEGKFNSTDYGDLSDILKNASDLDADRTDLSTADMIKNAYSIIDKNSGETLNVAEVGSGDLLSGNLRISQKGGAGNSLGRIVFRFPNNFSIYLHDTNNRGAFQRDRRTLSHGCVRVQKPFDLACYLLPDVDEWTRESIRISMDIPPVTDRGREWVRKHADAERPFRLISYHGVTPHVPLYILYYTAFPNPKTGVVDFWPDIYGFDKVISKELKWISEASSSR
jgi:hypothetical protein